MDALEKYLKQRIDNTRKINEKISERPDSTRYHTDMYIYNDGQIECMLEILEKIDWLKKTNQIIILDKQPE